MPCKDDFMPKDAPGKWAKATIVSEVKHHSALFGLNHYDTADVQTADGVLHKDVVVIDRRDDRKK